MSKKIILFFLLTVFLWANTNSESKHILILHSYHKSMGWVTNIDKAINDILKPNVNNYIVHTEYMDTKRIFSKEYLEKLNNIYKMKYKNIKFDLILSSDNNAFNFLRKYRDKLFGNVPVSFSGVNDFKDSYLEGLTNFTGATEVFDAKATIQSALEIYPKTKNIYVVNDYLTTGRAWTSTIKQQLKSIKQNIIFSPNTTLEDLQKELNQLPKNTIVLLGVYFKDKNGAYVTYERIGQLITHSSKSPVFCLLQFNLKGGVIGGSVISGYQQGKLQSIIGKKILEGIPVSELPIEKEGTTSFVFDYNSFKSQNISLKQLPSNSLILNKPITFYEKHKLVLLTTAVVVFILVLIIFILLSNIKKRKEAQVELEKSKNKIKDIHAVLEQAYEDITQYKYFFEQNKAVMLLTDAKDGSIIDVNHAGIIFYGFSKKELLSKNINEINILSKTEIKEEKAKAKKEKRNHFFFKHKVKDNTIKYVEVLSGPIILNNKKLLYSIIHDVTEHKQHEDIFIEQSKLASMGEMIGNIAHQWRQPLSVISTAATGMKLQKEFDNLSDEMINNTCNAINNNAQYLSKTIDDFKDFVKNDRKQVKFNLNDDITSFLSLVNGNIKNHNIEIILEVQEDINIIGYPNELIQCLINIFNNAKDELKEQTIENKLIFISTVTKFNNAIIKIKDNAGGIPIETLPKIFEPYFTTKHKSQGTGLGLSMTYNLIVGGMNGTIKVHNVEYTYENESYKGAEFEISLPI